MNEADGRAMQAGGTSLGTGARLEGSERLKAVSARVRGIDSLRFIFAMTVVFQHCGFVPIHTLLQRLPALAHLSLTLEKTMPNGPAAVIAFFVISGFCVHYPFRESSRVSLLSFYARRHLRILIPAAAAVALAASIKIHLLTFQSSILWSLVCEEIYYTAYPLFLWSRSKIGILPILVASYVASTIVVVSIPNTSGDYPAYGSLLNAVLGYPCWLLGALLAEQIGKEERHERGPSRSNIWAWRLAALFISTVLRALRFHTALTYPWTLNVFAIFIFFWLRLEIRYTRRNPPSNLLESAGAFSYSIYLVHLAANGFWLSNSRLATWDASHPLVMWWPKMVFIVVVSYLFYRLVERPAHHLARKFQKWTASFFERAGAVERPG